MRNLRFLLIAFALPILLVAYMVWVSYFQIKFNLIPTEEDENQFMVKYTTPILIWYYTFISAYICILLLM
jgi:hypothetical protein